MGADAVSVHVNIGSDTEERQLADLGGVAAECDRWGLPLLAMVYPRGPRITEPHDPALLAHVVNIAADLGADIVKTLPAAPVERMADVAASSPIPVVVAGGCADCTDLLDFARTVMAAGCHGLAIGRRVFQSPSPRDAVRELAAIIHGPRRTPAARPIPIPIPELVGAL
jgi:2-amino-4,5-dihydroxy-6-oxo-7-(phosphonooxy)heptanoate synthase